MDLSQSIILKTRSESPLLSAHSLVCAYWAEDELTKPFDAP
jgi:hypothetical protein